ncbi:MAG: bifunctional non-ous end joining protein LigD [Actinomycetota bacterium]|jgi:bifunctional non-homologous end joining protein LigD
MTATKRLKKYVEKRDFAKTSEPRGGKAPKKSGNRFVVQRHRARALHYDFRLEMDGVLVSWAVPKGPSLDPAAKRMAVHVEDHPLEYFDFEGVIPKGEYGGGDVIVWDWGTWSLARGDDPVQAVADGELHFEVAGEKLRGRFILVRRDKANRGDREQWLLFHKQDDVAEKGWNAEDFPQSVKSGRTNDEVKDAPKAKWTRSTPTVAAWARQLSFDPVTDDELEAFTAIRKEGTWEVGGVELRVTNLDKALFPPRSSKGKPITKRDLIRYHATIAPAMLPYLAGRPVNPHRFPDGVTKAGFWNKALPSHAPEWLNRFHYDDHGEGETEWYAVVDSVPAVAWMANFGAIELNPWTSRVEAPHEPTWALIDIDPGEKTTFKQIRELAFLYRAALDHLKLQAMPKVSGQRGIQVWVPIRTGYSFGDTSAFVEAISRTVGDAAPELVSWSWRKADRGGLARLDYTQNAINKTLVAPFSARPKPGAPVSVPVTWDELDDGRLRPDKWTIANVGKRLAEHGDPLRELIGLQQELPNLKQEAT